MVCGPSVSADFDARNRDLAQEMASAPTRGRAASPIVKTISIRPRTVSDFLKRDNSVTTPTSRVEKEKICSFQLIFIFDRRRMRTMNTQVDSKSHGRRRALLTTTIAAIVLLAIGLGYALLVLFLSTASESKADAAGISSSFTVAAVITAVGALVGLIAVVARLSGRNSSAAIL